MGRLDDILNWRQVDDRITLSGQPSETQLADLAGSGVTDVINLGPHDNAGALPDEAGTLADLGVCYHYIPVDFDNPTEADYAAFCAKMADLSGARVHVHCIFNARVSAFMLRYARDGHGDPAAAEVRMDGIWQPGGVWATFVDRPEDVAKPNRFAGYDY